MSKGYPSPEYTEIDDTYSLLAAGRWERNTRATLKSKRGQTALREIEAALLALPEKKLAYETFYKVERDDHGHERMECCVLGALAHHKGLSVPADLNGESEYDEPGDPGYQASWAEKNLGLRFTLAWNLIYENDDAGRDETPEQRYERVLRFVRHHIRAPQKEAR